MSLITSHALRRIAYPVPVVLFLLSAAGLIFEIAVTRLFSFFFQYHYAFLAVSLAVLGLSLGAAAAQKPGFLAKPGFLLMPLLALSLAFPIVAISMARLPWTQAIWPRAALALIPFILLGLWTAHVFTRWTTFSGLLYAADLAGAGVGVFIALGLLSLWSPFSVILFLGVIVGIAAIFLALQFSQSDRFEEQASPTKQNRRSRLQHSNSTPAPTSRSSHWPLAVAILVISGALWLSNLWLGWLDGLPTQFTDAPRDKTMLAVLNDPTQKGRLVQTAWSPFARVDVVETNDPRAKFVFADGGAGSYMLHFDGNLDRVNYLRNTPEFIPFAASPVTQTLILGAGAGKDIVMGLLAGAKQITAVEVNPPTVKVTQEAADYNGHILQNPAVNLVVGDARTFVERSNQHYDLIYLNLVYTQAAIPASQVLVENYTFTRQALRADLEHLTPGGHLAIVSHNALEGSRAAVTALQALADLAIPPARALDHLALVMAASDDPTVRTSVLVVGRGPLTQQTISGFTQNANAQNMQPLFIPGLAEAAFAPLRKGMSLQDFVVADAAYELGPTEDNQPFFFKLDPGLPPPIRQALIISAVLALLLLLLGLASAITQSAIKPHVAGRWWLALIDAALLGTGFMLIEAPLIQRFQLLLGYPVLSLATVLGALLLAGGMGSLISQRWSEKQLRRRIALAALWITGLNLLYWFVLPRLVHSLLPTALPVRILATILLTALPGVALGIPFPGLLRLYSAHSSRIALLWSINGAYAVLGSTLAMALAITAGFGAALLSGAALYGVFAVLILVMSER